MVDMYENQSQFDKNVTQVDKLIHEFYCFPDVDNANYPYMNQIINYTQPCVNVFSILLIF